MSLCKCFNEVREKLKAQGLKLSDKCFVLGMPSFSTMFGIPLERADGSRLKRGDPTMLFTARCPFCGKKQPKQQPPAEGKEEKL